jgi:iron complex outermembrane recepter protein
VQIFRKKGREIMKVRKIAVCALSALAVSMMSGQAFAQAAPQATDQSAGLNEIVVTGIRLSLQSALDQKKNSDQLKDSIVAEDIGKLPDNNVIEALQHVTGVQISRNAAETNQLLIRGLPDIETLLNGREIFTSFGRFVTLQDIPAELLARVDVDKSARADDIEGGIAGVIDVRLHRPFDFDGAEFAGTVRGTHDTLADTNNPTASVLASNRWNTDAGEFGLLADISYRKDRWKEEILDNYISSQSIGPVPGSTGPGGIAYLPLTEGGQSMVGDRERTSANISAQWSPNANTEVYAEGFYTRYRNPNNTDFFVGLPWLGADASTATVFPGTDEVKTVTAGGYDLTSDQSFVPKTDTVQFASGVTWTNDNVTLTSEVDYTNSKFSQTGYILDTEYYPPTYTADFNYNGTGTPYMNVSGIDMTNPANFHIRQLYDQWELQTGDEIDWRGDLTFKLDSSGWLKSFKTGIRIADRFAENREDNQGGLDCRASTVGASPQLLAAIASPACFTALNALPGVAYHVTSGSIFNGAFGLTNWTDASPTWLNNNIGYLRELFDQSATGLPPPADPTQSFDDREVSYAVYGKANFGFDLGSHPLIGNLGLRIVDTDSTYKGFTEVVTTTGSTLTAADTSKNEIDWLPSLNARLALEDDLFLRFAASKTVTRPTFQQLDPGLSLSASTATLLGSGTAGNPNLSPERSTNADLSLEYYFGRQNALTGAVFYRKIDGYIQSGITAETIANIVYQVTEPTNAPAGHIEGAEVGYTQFFDFLPGPFSGLGMQSNATYVQGEFQNISKWSYNLIGIYEKGPASFRIAYNWRSGFDVGPAPGGGMQPSEIYSDSQPWLDLSAAYKVMDRLTITFDATNLLDSYYQDHFGNQAVYPRDTRRFDQTYSVGVRFKL